jgi:hypothetical protein
MNQDFSLTSANKGCWTNICFGCTRSQIGMIYRHLNTKVVSAKCGMQTAGKYIFMGLGL